MVVFIIILVAVITLIDVIMWIFSGNSSSSIDNIATTEMMNDMYKDLSGKELDSVEKSILFMHNSEKNKDWEDRITGPIQNINQK